MLSLLYKNYPPASVDSAAKKVLKFSKKYKESNIKRNSLSEKQTVAATNVEVGFTVEAQTKRRQNTCS